MLLQVARLYRATFSPNDGSANSVANNLVQLTVGTDGGTLPRSYPIYFVFLVLFLTLDIPAASLPLSPTQPSVLWASLFVPPSTPPGSHHLSVFPLLPC